MISAFKTISISYSGRWSLVTLLVFFANDMGKYEPHESKVVILHKISTTLGTTATRIEHFFFKNRQLQLHVISVMIKKCEVWQSQRVSIPPAAALPPRSYKNLLNLLSACITTSQYNLTDRLINHMNHWRWLVVENTRVALKPNPSHPHNSPSSSLSPSQTLDSVGQGAPPLSDRVAWWC